MCESVRARIFGRGGECGEHFSRAHAAPSNCLPLADGLCADWVFTPCRSVPSGTIFDNHLTGFWGYL